MNTGPNDVHTDAGLAAYRTMLSWRRTALAVVVVTMTATASMLWQSHSPAAVLVVAGATLLAPLWWAIALVQGRYIWNAVVHAQRCGRAFTTMSATVSVCAVALAVMACVDASRYTR